MAMASASLCLDCSAEPPAYRAFCHELLALRRRVCVRLPNGGAECAEWWACARGPEVCGREWSARDAASCVRALDDRVRVRGIFREVVGSLARSSAASRAAGLATLARLFHRIGGLAVDVAYIAKDEEGDDDDGGWLRVLYAVSALFGTALREVSEWYVKLSGDMPLFENNGVGPMVDVLADVVMEWTMRACIVFVSGGTSLMNVDAANAFVWHPWHYGDDVSEDALFIMYDHLLHGIEVQPMERVVSSSSCATGLHRRRCEQLVAAGIVASV